MTANNATTLKWLDDHFDLFLPPLENAKFDRKLLQRVGELALLYRALESNGVFNNDIVKRWKACLIKYIESEELIEIARKNLGSSWAWLMPYFVFKDLHGITVLEHEKTIIFARESGYPDASEVVPYRKMDQHYFLAMHTGKELNVQEFVTDTSLSNCSNLLTINRDIAYSITHTLFYANDFGSKKMATSHPANKKCLQIINSLLPEFARKADWDVLGEIIILGLCTEGVDEAYLSAYLNLFRAQRHEQGYTPPSDATKAILSDDMDREKIFEACYHTTLVAALVEASYVRTQKAKVTRFEVACLKYPCQYDLLNKIVTARNKAVDYLNDISAKGIPIIPIAAFNTISTEESVEAPLDAILGTRENTLAYLEVADMFPQYAVIYQHAFSLAECFARNGDIELVLKLLGSCLKNQPDTPRLAALLHFVLQLQKPDGSVGYFLQEANMLGADNIVPIRNSLTDVYTEALDDWVDGQLERVV